MKKIVSSFRSFVQLDEARAILSMTNRFVVFYLLIIFVTNFHGIVGKRRGNWKWIRYWTWSLRWHEKVLSSLSTVSEIFACQGVVPAWIQYVAVSLKMHFVAFVKINTSPSTGLIVVRLKRRKTDFLCSSFEFDFVFQFESSIHRSTTVVFPV